MKPGTCRCWRGTRSRPRTDGSHRSASRASAGRVTDVTRHTTQRQRERRAGRGGQRCERHGSSGDQRTNTPDYCKISLVPAEPLRFCTSAVEERVLRHPCCSVRYIRVWCCNGTPANEQQRSRSRPSRTQEQEQEIKTTAAPMLALNIETHWAICKPSSKHSSCCRHLLSRTREKGTHPSHGRAG